MDDNQRIVITGVGVVAPNGIGKEAFWENCAKGVSGIKPITLFDTSDYRCHYAGEVSDFDPVPYLGKKGLRNLDRTTLLSLVAAKLAIEDSGIAITDENRDEIGVVLGSTMGSVKSISDFDMEGLREGPRYVNPAKFPNTVINSPASQVAIRFGLQGLNSTISTGFNASHDAVGYAMNMLKLGRAQTLLVGGVEELCLQTFLGFYKLGLMARGTFTDPVKDPFMAPHKGTVLGEGAALFALETYEGAKQRGAHIYAEILGYGQQFDPECDDRYNPQATGLMGAIEEAFADANLKPEDIDSVSLSANGVKGCAESEEYALEQVFGYRAKELTRTNIRKLIGESFSAGGAFQMAQSLVASKTEPITTAATSVQASANFTANSLVLGSGPLGHMTAIILKQG